MKVILITFLTILLVAVLIVGNTNWKNNQDSSSSIIENSNTSSGTDNSNNFNYYLSLASNWPIDAQNQLDIALKRNKPYRILLLGSNLIGDSEIGLLPNLQENLAHNYDRYVSVESLVYNDTSSSYLQSNELQNLIEKKPDMVIFEPFLLTDNNVIDIDTTLFNISNIIKEINSELPDVTFILQPPNQIYNATLYPTQVAALKEFAELKNIIFLDHWKNWPKGDENDILNYINQDGTPNKRGYEIWSNYITDFLVHK